MRHRDSFRMVCRDLQDLEAGQHTHTAIMNAGEQEERWPNTPSLESWAIIAKGIGRVNVTDSCSDRTRQPLQRNRYGMPDR